MKQQLKMQAGSMTPPKSVEKVKAMLDTTEKGGVRNSIKNCLTVFQHDPLLSDAIAYNLLTDRTDIVKPIIQLLCRTGKAAGLHGLDKGQVF